MRLCDSESEGPGNRVSWQSPETESLVGCGAKPQITPAELNTLQLPTCFDNMALV